MSTSKKRNPNLGGRREGSGRKAASKHGKRNQPSGIRLTKAGMDALEELAMQTGKSKNEIADELFIREWIANRKQ